MTDDKKISGKLTEQQLEMGLELLEKRAAVERKAPPRKKTGAQMKEAAAKALQKALPKTKARKRSSSPSRRSSGDAGQAHRSSSPPKNRNRLL